MHGRPSGVWESEVDRSVRHDTEELLDDIGMKGDVVSDHEKSVRVVSDELLGQQVPRRPHAQVPFGPDNLDWHPAGDAGQVDPSASVVHDYGKIWHHRAVCGRRKQVGTQIMTIEGWNTENDHRRRPTPTVSPSHVPAPADLTALTIPVSRTSKPASSMIVFMASG